MVRDDLHKKAPIPRKAQNVLKLALREADRNFPDRLQLKAQSALSDFVSRNFSRSVIRMLCDGQYQGDLFGARDAPRQARSPAEADLLAIMATRPGINDRQGVVLEALQNACDSYIREVRATLIAERVTDFREVIDAFSSALFAGAANVARIVCTGEVGNYNSPLLSLEDDLLAPKLGDAR